jgi:hypothetical protein
MAKIASRRLVIDASIARAAGPEESTHPTSKTCREFLLAVLHVCHRMVVSAAILEEWDKHQSGFSRRWRVSMFARKKIIREDVETDDAFRAQVAKHAVQEAETEIMHKDCHLIEAANATDSRVASLDEAVRHHFRQIARRVRKLRDVCWVNPNLDDDGVRDWLQEGAPLEKHRCLGHVPPAV